MKAAMELPLNPEEGKKETYEEASSQNFHNVESAVNADNRIRLRSV
jgi:hypothetical protein